MSKPSGLFPAVDSAAAPQAAQQALEDLADIERYYLGSLGSGGNSDPKAGNSLGAWTEMFGDYKPAGKLSFSWPRSMDQIPINLGDPRYDPLFKYGYGL
jgi:hypothetical protein